MPESPKWQYINFYFEESRESLQDIGRFNMLSERSVDRLGRLTFDIEVLDKLKKQSGEGAPSDSKFSNKDSLANEIEKRRDTISDTQYTINLVIMSIQWSASSFSTYLLLFMNKYYEGSIYINNILDSTAVVLGMVICFLLYGYTKIQWLFIGSISLTLIGGVFLLCFQEDFLSPTWIAPFVPEKSPFEPESEEDKMYYMGYTIPFIVFVTKIGI